MKTILSLLLVITFTNISIGQTTAIPDANFEQALIDRGYDTGAPDGVVPTANIDTVTSLTINSKGIIDLTGIGDFIALKTLSCYSNKLVTLDLSKNTALTELYCFGNRLTDLDLTQNTALTHLRCRHNELTSIDISKNTKLTELICYYNQLTSIDISKNTVLTELRCYGNQLTSIDISKNTALKVLNCADNQLTSIDISKNTMLTELSCSDNPLTSIDISKNTVLKVLSCSNNQLTSIDISRNTTLTHLYCIDNQITSLDLSKNTDLRELYCSDNELTYLNLKNGNNTKIAEPINFVVWHNPSLTCIQVDDPVYSTTNWTVVDPIASFSTNCCPGLALNIDSTNNVSCVGSGKVFNSANGGTTPYRYVWNNAPSGSIITTDSVGLHFITVTDAVNCNLTKGTIVNGRKKLNTFDLNTSLSSLGFRPGRLSNLDLSAWNDGCVLTSGQLSISYSGPITFMSSSITPDNNISNTLTWDFSNWSYSINQFFSSLEFKVNTTANLGDRICFDVKITPIAGDADTNNNYKTYCFAVVNSYDPNDKQVYPQGTCAENYVIKTKPLTYTVRFQNTGNAPAIDIFLLDTLSAYLDVNTLRVLTQSHQPLITEVLEDSIIKFRFDNINLADSLSDAKGSQGYVTYEIYPKSGLSDGLVVENSAAIYFDFNAPIITNATKNTLVDVLPTPTTTILNENLSTSFTLNSQTYSAAGTYKQYFYANDGCDSTVVLNLKSVTGIADKEQHSTVSIYPNPATNKISINTEQAIDEVNIIDLTGKVILTTTKQTKTIDIADLTPGIYFIRISAAENTITKKLVKR